jgi:hypothetical protein
VESNEADWGQTRCGVSAAPVPGSRNRSLRSCVPLPLRASRGSLLVPCPCSAWSVRLCAADQWVRPEVRPSPVRPSVRPPANGPHRSAHWQRRGCSLHPLVPVPFPHVRSACCTVAFGCKGGLKACGLGINHKTGHDGANSSVTELARAPQEEGVTVHAWCDGIATMLL